MRVFFCTKEERRVRNRKPEEKAAEEYPALASSRRASLTVEAAFVLPVFLFAMLVFLYFMRLLQGYDKIQEGLTLTVRAASQYGILEKERFYEYLEENGGSFRYIQGGKRGISLKKSCILPVTEKILVTAEYKVVFPVPFFENAGIVIHQKAESRVFSGVQEWRQKKDGAADEFLVYITEYGSVYHLHESCSYLNPSIRMVWGEEVFKERNKKGGKYQPCEACMKGETVSERSLYITEEGDCFHSSPGCRGLKRNIYAVPYSKVGGLGCCSKCRE